MKTANSANLPGSRVIGSAAPCRPAVGRFFLSASTAGSSFAGRGAAFFPMSDEEVLELAEILVARYPTDADAAELLRLQIEILKETSHEHPPN